MAGVAGTPSGATGNVGQALASAIGFPGPTMGPGTGSSGGAAAGRGLANPGGGAGVEGGGPGGIGAPLSLQDYLNSYNPILQLLQGKGDSPLSINDLISLAGGGGALISGGGGSSTNNAVASTGALSSLANAGGGQNPLSAVAPALSILAGQILNPLSPINLPDGEDDKGKKGKKKRVGEIESLTSNPILDNLLQMA